MPDRVRHDDLETTPVSTAIGMLRFLRELGKVVLKPPHGFKVKAAAGFKPEEYECISRI